MNFVGSQQALASLALGRLEGRLATVTLYTARFLAARVIRDVLVAALAQEGHRFTEARFAAWFAGLTTLSDEPLRFAPAPRGLAEAMLSELAASRWQPLATTAMNMQTALLAPREAADAESRDRARAALDEAASIASSIPPAALPFPALSTIHSAISRSARFSLAERTSDMIRLDNLQLILERERPPSPRWPLELACGGYLRVSGILPADLPMIGAIRLDAAGAPEAGNRIMQAEALGHSLTGINKALAESVAVEAEAATLFAKQRTHSRSPQLYGLLRSFGPLRSAQIESIFGVTRLGVRTMLRALEHANILETQTIAGAKLYSARPLPPSAAVQDAATTARASMSQDTLAEYDAPMAHIDALLTRYGGN